MNTVIKFFRNFAEQIFNVSVTTFSYWSGAVLFIALMRLGKPLKILKISCLYCLVVLNLVN